MSILKYYFHPDLNMLTLSFRVLKHSLPCKFSPLVRMVKATCLLCMQTCIRHFKKHIIVLGYLLLHNKLPQT